MRVLEISRLGLFKGLQPNATDWIRWGGPLTAGEPLQPDLPSSGTFARTVWRIGIREFDLMVLPAIHPTHIHAQTRGKLAVKSVLRTASRFRILGSALHRFGLRSCRHVILDISDDRHVCRTSLRLFPGSAAYFKRELDLDDVEKGLPAEKIRPLPLILPDERRIPAPRKKEIDLFFAGAICNDTRRKAIEHARALARKGLRVVVSQEPLPYQAYMDALANSWLVLSPEGYGWDCYRHYEACLAGSVPLINRPAYRRRIYLKDGLHCFYYDAEAECLVARVPALLSNKERLAAMGEEGRRHVLRNHTRAAVARYILRATFGAVDARSADRSRAED
jgi:glycosyl transferase family 1